MKTKDTKAFQKLSEILKRDNVECPICHNRTFRLLDGYVTHPVQEHSDRYVLQNESILPCIAIVCSECGFVSQHFIQVLDPEVETNTGKG